MRRKWLLLRRLHAIGHVVGGNSKPRHRLTLITISTPPQQREVGDASPNSPPGRSDYLPLGPLRSGQSAVGVYDHAVQSGQRCAGRLRGPLQARYALQISGKAYEGDKRSPDTDASGERRDKAWVALE